LPQTLARHLAEADDETDGERALLQLRTFAGKFVKRFSDVSTRISYQIGEAGSKSAGTLGFVVRAHDGNDDALSDVVNVGCCRFKTFLLVRYDFQTEEFVVMGTGEY
jgi:hypothetical protein